VLKTMQCADPGFVEVGERPTGVEVQAKVERLVAQTRNASVPPAAMHRKHQAVSLTCICHRFEFHVMKHTKGHRSLTTRMFENEHQLCCAPLICITEHAKRTRMLRLSQTLEL
jgi:hypothetical protein